jgi:hypothetical protein
MAANHNNVPRKEDMYNPLLQALRDLGGSGTIDEIAEHVITALRVPDDVASLFHNPETSIGVTQLVFWAVCALVCPGLRLGHEPCALHRS